MSRIYVALDLETTGLNPERDAIIEIGVVRFREDGTELEAWSTLVNPGVRIPYKIERLTGISAAELEGAPPLSAVAGRLGRLVGDAPIVGHNVSFDLGFLNAHGVSLNNPVLDTFELAAILLPAMPSYNLGVLATALAVNTPIQHRALADARMARDLFLALLARLDEMDLDILQEINRLAAHNPAVHAWGPRDLFRQVERRRVRTAFESPIAAQLRARGTGTADAVGFFLVGEEPQDRLKPAETRTPLDVEALAALIAPGGAFARGFAGFEHRPEQVRMLRAVAQAFNDDAHLLVEAGTGVGKSLAYLLPAALHALQNGERVVISTNTINLQDQLYTKDIPDVRRVLAEAGLEQARSLRTTLVKGRANYLCLRRWTLFRRRDDLSLDEFRVLVKVLAWLPHTEIGDRAELNFGPGEWPVWDQLRSDDEACDPGRCPFFRDSVCFFYRAHQRAGSAHLVVVNHALLLSDMTTGNRVLPDYSYLVVDEAHHLEDQATEHLGFALDGRGLERFLDGLAGRGGRDRAGGLVAEIAGRVQWNHLSPAARQALDDALAALRGRTEDLRPRIGLFFAALSDFLSQYGEGAGTYDTPVRLVPALRAQPDWQAVEIAGDNLRLALLSLTRSLRRLTDILAELDEAYITDYDALLGEMLNARNVLTTWQEQFNQVLFEPQLESVYWCTLPAAQDHQPAEITLHAAPLHVGELLQKQLFDKKKAVILTSATLSTGGTFDYVRERLGLTEVRETLVGSPFDYQSAALLYVPTDIPEPGQPYHQKAVESALIALCQATEGRALVLFTSYSQLRTTYKAIMSPLEAAGIAVLGQRLDGSRRHLLETFKSGQRTVLLGTSSFWEGIDVVGEALSVLVIVRLPFTVPSDPIFAARSETFEYDAFNQYAVPQAVLRFKQGFGRLIRSRTDRGVVVIMDRRLLTKRYGQMFLQSLPDCTRRQGPVSRLPAIALDWLAGTEGGRMRDEG